MTPSPLARTVAAAVSPDDADAVRDLPAALAFAYLLSRPFHAAAVERGEAEG